MRKQIWSIVALVFLLIGGQAVAYATTIGFDSLADAESVTTQFSGLTFANTTALTAGVGLNEFEFPPGPPPMS